MSSFPSGGQNVIHVEDKNQERVIVAICVNAWLRPDCDECHFKQGRFERAVPWIGTHGGTVKLILELVA